MTSMLLFEHHWSFVLIYIILPLESQFGLWAAVDDVKHRLSFTTWTLVSCCMAPLITTGCTVTSVSPEPEAVYMCPVTSWQIKSWLPDCGFIR